MDYLRALPQQGDNMNGNIRILLFVLCLIIAGCGHNPDEQEAKKAINFFPSQEIDSFNDTSSFAYLMHRYSPEVFEGLDSNYSNYLVISVKGGPAKIIKSSSFAGLKILEIKFIPNNDFNISRFLKKSPNESRQSNYKCYNIEISDSAYNILNRKFDETLADYNNWKHHKYFDGVNIYLFRKQYPDQRFYFTDYNDLTINSKQLVSEYERLAQQFILLNDTDLFLLDKIN